MESKITVRNDYILVEPQEVELWEILRSLRDLLQIPEYPNKNVIWVFRESSVNMDFEELHNIKKFAKNNIPENPKPDRKVAIVAETGFHEALATVYTGIEIDLPVEFEVFSDLSTAENWINK